MLIALLLASVAVDPPKDAPILAADPRFECRVGRKCFVLTRDGSDLLVPSGPEAIEPLRKAVQARDRAGLDEMLRLGTAFRVASGTPVVPLEQGPIVEGGPLLTDRETSIVDLPDARAKRLLYWKVQFLTGPGRDRIAVVAPENLGRLAEFRAATDSRVRVAGTPAHAAVAAFTRAAVVDNLGKTADALTLYQAVLDEHPRSDAAVLARIRIRAIKKQR